MKVWHDLRAKCIVRVNVNNRNIEAMDYSYPFVRVSKGEYIVHSVVYFKAEKPTLRLSNYLLKLRWFVKTTLESLTGFVSHFLDRMLQFLTQRIHTTGEELRIIASYDNGDQSIKDAMGLFLGFVDADKVRSIGKSFVLCALLRHPVC